MRSVTLLVLAFFCTLTLRLPGMANGQANSTATTNTDLTPLRGSEIVPAKESHLLRELGKTPHHESQTRRFEIVFFVSLPVTLMLAYSLMEGLSRNTYDRNNPERKIQQPHYIYMFSTSLLTSLYIAIQDARRHPIKERPKATDVSEVQLKLPVVGVRF